MADSFNVLVGKFCATADKAASFAVALRAHFEDATNRNFVRAEVMPAVAAHYGIKLVAKERGTGLTFGPKDKTPAQRCSELVSLICGPKSGQKAEVAPPTKAQIKAAREYMALFADKASAKRALDAVV